MRPQIKGKCHRQQTPYNTIKGCCKWSWRVDGDSVNVYMFSPWTLYIYDCQSSYCSSFRKTALLAVRCSCHHLGCPLFIISARLGCHDLGCLLFITNTRLGCHNLGCPLFITNTRLGCHNLGCPLFITNTRLGCHQLGCPLFIISARFGSVKDLLGFFV